MTDCNRTKKEEKESTITYCYFLSLFVLFCVLLLLLLLKRHSIAPEREEDERLRDEKQRVVDELVPEYAIRARKEEKSTHGKLFEIDFSARFNS